MDLEGSVVEFIDSGALKLGYVRKREHRKVQVVDQRGRESSVPVSRVIVVHEAMPEEEFATAGSQILERVEALSAEVDVALLWDTVHKRLREYSLTELTEAYFGDRKPESESAVYRALSAGTLYFRRSAAGFEPRSAPQVDAEKLRRTRQESRDRYRAEVTRLLRQAMTEESSPQAMREEKSWAEVLLRLERWLRQNDRNDVGEVMERIAGEVRAREVAYDLLVRHGQVPATEDRFLLVRGMPTTFSREIQSAAASLSAQPDVTDRVRYLDRETFAIDDAHTVEIDDALTVTAEGTDTIVGIHIADVSSFVVRGDILDREALRRSSTIYLPNVSVTMFPPRLATNLASLVEHEVRPAFTAEVRFSADGSLTDFRFFRSIIRVTRRLDYGEADQALNSGDPALSRLHAVALRLHAGRAKQGAQIHRRPDIKVHVRGDEIIVERLEADTPARLIVSEMMILVNHLAAAHAAKSGIPIIFRTQEPPSESRPDTAGLPEVIQFELLRRNFKRSRLSLYPSPHAGLGLPQYTQMSSPIRRYADLVTQRQFTAAIEGHPFPYERDELLEVMTSCEAREIEIRRLEQTSTTWWILTYLERQHLDHPLEAVVVDNKGSVELTDFQVRAKLADHDELSPGDTVTVRIEAVDPDHGVIRLHTQ